MPKDVLESRPKFNIPSGLESIPSNEELDRKLKYFELLERQRKEEQYQAQADQESRAKAQVLQKILQGEQETRLAQENCIHLKPNNRPAICGQRDASHNGHFICQLCGKEYTNVQSETNPDGLPFYLYQHMDLDTIGGPTY